MKKTIIVLALALIMVIPMFAASVDAVKVAATTGNQKVLAAQTQAATKDTKIDIELKQYPKYMCAITSVKYDDSNKLSKDNYMNVEHEDEITMDVDADNYKLVDKTGYYLTYFAYENNENVKYTIQLSGNMKLDATAAAAATEASDSQKEVTYTMSIDGLDDIESTDTEEKTLKTINATNLIGKTEFGSLAITLKNHGDDTFKNNVAGSYAATATIKIASNN